MGGIGHSVNSANALSSSRKMESGLSYQLGNLYRDFSTQVVVIYPAYEVPIRNIMMEPEPSSQSTTAAVEIAGDQIRDLELNCNQKWNTGT
jgi:hypothetical protein